MLCTTGFDSFISTRIAFLGYVQRKLDDVKPLFIQSYAASLQSQLDSLRGALSTMKEGASDVRDTWSQRFGEVRTARLQELGVDLSRAIRISEAFGGRYWPRTSDL